jgi:large subunit ribosomal protein L9
VKVVFLETVEGSGLMGEVKDVARGYARNYLLPRGLAAPATPDILKRAEELREIEEERQRAQDEHAQELVGKLEGEPLVMAVRVGEQGRLYGSVTNVDIAEKAGEILGEELDRRRILLPEAIRNVGVYTVGIRLSRNVQPEVQVVVVDAEAPEGVDAAAEALLNPPAPPEIEPPPPVLEEAQASDETDATAASLEAASSEAASSEAMVDTVDAEEEASSEAPVAAGASEPGISDSESDSGSGADAGSADEADEEPSS